MGCWRRDLNKASPFALQKLLVVKFWRWHSQTVESSNLYLSSGLQRPQLPSVGCPLFSPWVLLCLWGTWQSCTVRKGRTLHDWSLCCVMWLLLFHTVLSLPACGQQITTSLCGYFLVTSLMSHAPASTPTPTTLPRDHPIAPFGCGMFWLETASASSPVTRSDKSPEWFPDLQPYWYNMAEKVFVFLIFWLNCSEWADQCHDSAFFPSWP